MIAGITTRTITLSLDDLPSDAECRDILMQLRYPSGTPCPKCGKSGERMFYALKGRKSYTCAKCGWHISPTANTIFHKTPLPLQWWLWVILRLATEKKVTAKSIERELAVPYKTAWRMRALSKRLLKMKL